MSVAKSLSLTLACLAVVMLSAPPARASQVQLEVAASHPTMLAGEKKLNYLRVALTGFELESATERPPVNVAIVLDKSGSMSGAKIEQAKAAAINAIQRLEDSDIVSVVIYDHNVSVLVPATKASDRQMIIKSISRIQSGGDTALFAGVSKGAAEVRKFRRDDMVNRVILLSDGKANVGPSSTGELSDLGASLLKEGISVTTMGLGSGYNEDLMTSLASASSGNHAFIEEASDMVAVFNNEFDDILSVVATDFEIEVKLDESVRPVRVLGSDADIEGHLVRLPLTQLYSKQLRNFVVEVEVQPGAVDQVRTLAEVSVRYQNLQTETEDKLVNTVQLRFTDDVARVESDINAEAYAYCTLQISSWNNRQATLLRDQGRIGEAQKLLVDNTALLRDCKLFCGDNVSADCVQALDYGISNNFIQAEVIADPTRWNQTRKQLRQFQRTVEAGQTYNGQGKVGAGQTMVPSQQSAAPGQQSAAPGQQSAQSFQQAADNNIQQQVTGDLRLQRIPLPAPAPPARSGTASNNSQTDNSQTDNSQTDDPPQQQQQQDPPQQQEAPPSDPAGGQQADQ